MKTLNKITLKDFLRRVNKNRKRFGDMFVERLKDRTDKMVIRFSKIDKQFQFSWDTQYKQWMVTK